MLIRKGNINDLEKIYLVERECFPPNEAATKVSLENRLYYYANHFWLLFKEDILVSFVDGMVTNEKDLRDEMYENASMHDENGDWQMIFGVNTIPNERHQGYASLLIQEAIKTAKEENREGIVLTCKEGLIGFYEQFGFRNEGISNSNHGDVIWYQMRLILEGETE